MAVLLDRVKETTTTTGTVTIVLGGAVVDFRSFNSSIANGTTVRYGIDDYAGNWELGDGVVGTGTLTRSPIKSSNGNALVNFGVGTKYVYVTAIVADYLPDQTGNSTKILSTDGTNPSWIANTVGTVTAVSVTSANGFAGTSSGGATPALTISTSVTGVLKGNGTTISAATSGTDYSVGTSSLATGILKSTTTSGALSIAVAADFPTLNQNTTGSSASCTGNAATATTATNQSGGTVNATTGTFSSTMTLPTGAGSNYIKAGTGDGASFTTYNLKINSWWGIGFGDYRDLTTVKAYIDCRSGNIGTSGAFVGNVTGNISGSSASCTGNAAGLSVTLVASSGGTGLTSVGSSGNVLTSNGTSWVSSAPSGGSLSPTNFLQMGSIY